MKTSLVAKVLSAPEHLSRLDLKEWDRLIREARATQLLGRVAYMLRMRRCNVALPEDLMSFILAHEDLVLAQHDAVRYEACALIEALSPLEGPVIFLKGAGHILSANAASIGRTLGDVDIMVPRQVIQDAELRLKIAGWSNAHYSAYDQRYFREWMHELPAMHHRTRRSVLDLHHTILPPTARSRVKPEKLFAAAQPVPELPNAYTLSPADTLIHCAAHLFHEGEFEKGLRDLSDFDLLSESLLTTQEASETLLDRALELDLAWPLFLALRYRASLFKRPSGLAAITLLEQRLGPSAAALTLLDRLFPRAFLPHHPLYDDPATHVARSLLYLRSHWLRMPPLLLARHLFHKAVIRVRGKELGKAS